MKAFADAKSILLAQLRKLHAERELIESNIYKLEQAIKQIDSVDSLKRIRRVRHKLTCTVCKKDFTSGTAGTLYCSKECTAKAKKRGVTLVPGDGTKTDVKVAH